MANLDSDQLEQLQEVGIYLRQVRQELSQSLEEIATRIFIRPSLLRAIEEADADPLPEPVFIHGFIRRYGDALGLDGMALADNFSVKTAMAHSTATAPAAFVAKPLPPEPAATATLTPAPPAQRRSESTPAGPLLAIAAFVIVIIGAVVALPRLLQPAADAPDPAPEATTEPAPEDTAAPDPVATPEPATPAAPETPASTAPVSVSVNLTGDSWMRVIVDGQSQFEGLLTAGSQETWEGQEEITITAGNAGAVALSANGEEAVPVGSPGQVQTVTFTPNSAGNATP
ncbi:helix-turn-helix domain-containing protein [Almyronema epifaneia]|uniref:helix-turn-helix domain-containing protein n=1 Tax=Almyronema epifaneia TaxID=3114805 RepID=UPI00367334D4